MQRILHRCIGQKDGYYRLYHAGQLAERQVVAEAPSQLSGLAPASAFGHGAKPGEFQLPMRLTVLKGTHRHFKRLQVTLQSVLREDTSLRSIDEVHSQLKVAGATPEYLQKMIRDYFLNEEQPFPVIEALDVRLLACHNVLLEDLSPAILAEFLENPGLLQRAPDAPSSDLAGEKRRCIEDVWMDMYGDSNLPILKPEAKADALAADDEKTQRRQTQRRRQLAIERVTMDSAICSWLELQRAHEDAGRAGQGGMQQRLWKSWVPTIANLIADPKSALAKGSGSKSFLKLQTSGLEPELLVVIASQTLLSLLFLPVFRHKDERLQAAQKGLFGQVPFVTAATAVGEAVEAERWHRERTKLRGDKDDKLNSFHKQKHIAAFQSPTRTVQIGAALVDLLLDHAKVSLPEKESEVQDGSPRNGDGPRVVEVQAFQHAMRREGKKQVGILMLHPLIRAQMDEEEHVLSFAQLKHKPMVIPPQPWRPCGKQPQGPYLMQGAEFVRTTSQSSTNLRFYSPTRACQVMDSLGRMPWKINQKILEVMKETQARDLGIADIPTRSDPEVPRMSDEELQDLPERERKELRLKIYNAEKRCRELQSERPTFLLKLQVAEDFRHAEKIYFPHNVDFRGRAYPVPPHLNHIGDDVSRGLLMFAEPKALGPDGLFWLKVNFANLFGKNKISFEERADWVDAQRDWILEVAADPLSPSSVARWSNADDGPWQVLARCFEFAEVWAAESPEEFRSFLPVHMDGSCNGLQHYAGLGRDLEGGKAVNLYPADKPQDVYTVVLQVVKQKVHASAEATPDDDDEEEAAKRQLAQRLIELDVLQRKVVKQTIMTICYGVTTVGAIQQVRGQLEDMVGDKVEAAEIQSLAKYLAQLVLSSIKEVFAQAKLIQNWFDQNTKILNRLQAPTSWISPIGLDCVQPYRTPHTVSVRTRRQNVTLKTGESVLLNKSKQRMGLPPNFIHSLDATHMMMVAERCEELNIAFAAVHDSFWTHAADITQLNKIIRECFIELYEQPILAEFYEDLHVHLGGQVPPDLPPQGTLDLNVIRDS
eukprot:CAMPEP_0181400584 /NCGR_PEP_ID=MMETSP1110-20121109/2189_1 /TAXON_ID=174948 /ORGANISM="Symbiodinium sp., Strain CCMP421" /LENGTH=1047 /DNA_ID=CAMNT_0023522685 /DNA_START=38 /DNA_END=3178 /DNA_ORIENTATION=-